MGFKAPGSRASVGGWIDDVSCAMNHPGLVPPGGISNCSPSASRPSVVSVGESMVYQPFFLSSTEGGKC